jgi:hypothetical protein
MKRTKEFNNILNDCLERLLVKGETIEQCLQSYPEHAAEIEPLLQMAMATKKAVAIQPSPEFKARARYQFQSALREVKPKRALPFFGWQPQWAVAVAVVLAVLLAGGGTVTAAGYSMPDSPLYPVKLATEQVQLTLTPSDIGKAELHAKLADRRVAEIVYITNKGKPKQIEQIAQRLNKHLAMIASLPLAEKGAEEEMPMMVPAPPSPQEEMEAPAPQPAEAPGPRQQAEEGAGAVQAPANAKAKLRMLLKHNEANHPAILSALLEKVPESAKPALRRAIAASEANYRKALEALD